MGTVAAFSSVSRVAESPCGSMFPSFVILFSCEGRIRTVTITFIYKTLKDLWNKNDLLSEKHFKAALVAHCAESRICLLTSA